MPYKTFSGGRHYRWQEAAGVRFAPEESCPVLAFVRSLDQLDQRAQVQGRRDPRRHVRASNRRAERRGSARGHANAMPVILTMTAVAPCYHDCEQVRGFLLHWQTEVVLERGVGRHEKARDQLRGSAGRSAKPGEPGKLEQHPAGFSAASLSACSTSSDRVRGSRIRRKARISLSPCRSLCAEDTLSFIFELPDFL